MKVVITGTRGIPGIMGGVESCVEQIAPRLAAKGVDVTVIRRPAYADKGPSEWKGVKIVDVPAPKKKAFEAIVHTFRALLWARKHDAGLVHINAVGPALLTPLARMMGMKVIFTHHGFDYEREKWSKPAKFMLRLGERLGCRYAHEIIAISSVIKERIEAKYGRAGHVHLIHNGADTPVFCDGQEYLESLGLQKRGYVLGMARFVPEKRLDDLVEAFHEAGKTIQSDIRLVLAGDADFEDDYSRRLKKLAAEKGVTMTGMVMGEKLQTLLTNARCFVLPSSHEGMAVSLLEAMSYSLPVIASDIPANREFALPECQYFPVGDREALRKKLEELLVKPFEPHIYDMSLYDWDIVTERILEIYERQDI